MIMITDSLCQQILLRCCQQQFLVDFLQHNCTPHTYIFGIARKFSSFITFLDVCIGKHEYIDIIDFINHLLSSHRCLRLPLQPNSITRIFLTLPQIWLYSHTFHLGECFSCFLLYENVFFSKRRYPRFCGRRRSMLLAVGCRRRSTIIVEVSQRAMRCAKSREVTLPSDSFDPRVAWWRFANDYTAIGT